MRKNNKSKLIGRLLIDLTPLLDAIFIVLIVVLTGQNNYSSEADKKIEKAEKYIQDAERDISSMQDQVTVYMEQLDSFENIDQVMNYVTVFAGYDPTDRRNRTVYIMIGNNKPRTFVLTPSVEDKVWRDCKIFIEDIISEDNDKPMILSLGKDYEEKMLYRDEQKIKELFNDLMEDHGNIYQRGQQE